MKLRIGIAVIFAVFALFIGADELLRSGSENAQAEDIALTVYKSPTCGCCEKWIDHLEENEFSTDIRHPADMNGIKNKHGIRPQYQSCHTAVHESGYVFEGHIPAEIIARFLEQPVKESVGLAVPGMPVGSPGMEYRGRVDPYTVRLLMRDGSADRYASVTSQGVEYHY